MDLKTYAKEAQRTAKDQSQETICRVQSILIGGSNALTTTAHIMDTQRSNDLIHGILGMVGEMGELKLATETGKLYEILEEIGDFCWYGALVARAMQWDMSLYLCKDNFGNYWANDMVQGVGQLAEHLKKWLMYGKPISDVQMLNAWCDAMGAAVHRAGDWDSFENEVLKGNIDKLRLRFPEQFTEKAAIERADKAG
jgi:hypothetical protein